MVEVEDFLPPANLRLGVPAASKADAISPSPAALRPSQSPDVIVLAAWASRCWTPWNEPIGRPNC